VVLLLYCIRLPPACGRRFGDAITGLECRGREGADYGVKREAAGGGPRSAIAATVHRVLRATAARRRHRPGLAVRERGSVRGRRAWVEEWEMSSAGESGAADRYVGIVEALRHHRPSARRECARRPAPHSCDGVEENATMSASGKRPITSLSDAAEPQCVSVKDCCWGGGSHLVIPPEPLPVSCQAATARRLSVTRSPASETGQVADYGRLRWANMQPEK
jgi:hypothetical protein